MSTSGGPTTRPIPTVPSGDAAKAAADTAAAEKAAADKVAAEKAAAAKPAADKAGGTGASAPARPSVPPMPQRPAPRVAATGATGAAGGPRPAASAPSRPAATSGTPATSGAAASRPPQRPSPRPGTAAPAAAVAAGAPRAGRKVQLAVTRIEPWSAFKMSLLLSTAAAVGFIVGTILLWSVLKGMGVYDDIDGVIKSLQSNTADPFSIMDYIGLGRVTSLAMVIGVVDVVLLTALGTLGAYLYNVCASLVGGVQLILTDD